MFYKFLHNKTGSRISVNEQLSEELHKLVIKKFKRRRVYARFKRYICWAADLAKMGSLSAKIKRLIFIICHRCFHQVRIG